MTINLEAARALLAGFIAGVAGGLLSSPIAMLAILRSGFWRNRGNPDEHGGISPTALGFVVANGMLFVWTLVGLILGAVYLGSSQPQFSLTVTAVLLGVLGGAAFVLRRLTWPMWTTALLAVLAFAGLLPFLASLD